MRVHTGRLWMAIAAMSAGTLLGGAIFAQDAPGEKSRAVELKELYEADQADRSHATPPTPEQWKEIVQRDKERRDRVLALVRSGALNRADDYFRAAMVLQHAEGSEHVLIAHILATVAGFKGHEAGRWLSAAALDRYLHRIEQPQMLGTQFVRDGSDRPWSQGKYDPWLPDSIRAEYGVPPIEEQEARVDKMNGKTGPGGN